MSEPGLCMCFLGEGYSPGLIFPPRAVPWQPHFQWSGSGRSAHGVQWSSSQYLSVQPNLKTHLSLLRPDATTHLAQFPVNPQRTRKWVFVMHDPHDKRPAS